YDERTTAAPVGHAPPQRRRRELRCTERRDDQRDLERRGIERRRIERQYRHHDAEAEHVDQHSREQYTLRLPHPCGRPPPVACGVRPQPTHGLTHPAMGLSPGWLHHSVPANRRTS